MNHRVILTSALFMLSVSMHNSAFAADTKDDINSCQIALQTESEGKYANATLKLKSLSGNSRRKLKFQMTFNDETHTVVCRVTRGEVKEIVWPTSLDYHAKEIATPIGASSDDSEV